MTPLASVAMLEKLALLKIALCRAPALSSASSACLRAVLSWPSERAIRVHVSLFPLFIAHCPACVTLLKHLRHLLPGRPTEELRLRFAPVAEMLRIGQSIVDRPLLKNDPRADVC